MSADPAHQPTPRLTSQHALWWALRQVWILENDGDTTMTFRRINYASSEIQTVTDATFGRPGDLLLDVASGYGDLIVVTRPPGAARRRLSQV